MDLDRISSHCKWEYRDFEMFDPIDPPLDGELEKEMDIINFELQKLVYKSPEDLIPDLLVCYALKFRIELVFTDYNVSYEDDGAESSEPVFQELLSLTNQLFKGDYDYKKLENYYLSLYILSPDGIYIYITCHLQEIMENIFPNLSNSEYSQLHTGILYYINDVCSANHAKTVLAFPSGGTVAFAANWFNLKYTIYENSAITVCILKAIFYICHTDCRVLFRKKQLQLKDYDALVCMLPQDYSSENFGEGACTRGLRKAYEGRKIHDTLFDEILSGNTPRHCAVIVVNREFCYSDRFYEIRKQLVKNNWISEVTSIPDYMQERRNETGIIIVLNFKPEYENISFCNPAMLRAIIKKSEDPHSSLDYDEKDFPFLYDISEREVIEFDTREYVRRFRELSNYCDVPSKKVSEHAYMLVPELYCNYELIFDNEVCDACLSDFLKVHIEGTESPNTIRIMKKGQDFLVLDFIDNPSVDFNYLLYEINSDKFQNYLSLITQLPESEYVSFDSLILNYRMNFPCMEEQREIVESNKNRQNPIIQPRNVYNVVVAGDVEIADFSKWDINILAQVNSSETYNDVINDSSISRLLDAIIINVNLDMSNGRYKGLRHILKDKKHLIFIIGDVNMNDLEADLDPEDLAYCKDGKIFSNQELEDLIRALRNELDIQNTPESKIKEYYHDVFEASSHIDEYFKLEKPISDFLIQIILDSYKNDNLTDAYDHIRAICERLIVELQNINVLPPLKSLGAVTQFLVDRFYDDAQIGKCYLRNKIISIPLAESLNYLTRVCNTAIHTQEKEPQLGMAVLNILMSFILWFDGQISSGLFAQKHNSEEYWFLHRDMEALLKECQTNLENCQADCLLEVDCLRKENGSSYFFCGQIHLQSSSSAPLKRGMKIKIKRVELERIPYVDKNHLILFYANKDNYEIY